MPVFSIKPRLGGWFAACLLAGAIAVAPIAVAPVGAQSPASQYRGLATIDIPFANGPIRADHVPEIRLKLKGAPPHRFGMDTGSTGIVVAAEHFEPGPGDTNDGPGQLTYNSSGRILHGTHYTTDVEILDNGDRPVATARVQVLRVDRITCQRNARDCEPNPRPRGVAFMGVGFARGQAQGTSDSAAPRNPFVNLVSLASGAPMSSIRPGYIVTRTGIHLGMSEALTRNFAFVKLSPSGATSTTGLPQWSAAPLTVSVDGQVGTGTLLPDTGINYMFVSPPPGTPLSRGQRVPSGTKVEIWLPGQGGPGASYRLSVGDWNNPLQPTRVVVVNDAGVFVNTGRMFFEGFDYLYDAAGGYVGYGWNGRVSSAYGQVTPGSR
jgi:hypothetical protein